MQNTHEGSVLLLTDPTQLLYGEAVETIDALNRKKLEIIAETEILKTILDYPQPQK